MKLPFLLNSVSRSNNTKEIEQVFGKFLKVLPTLDGQTVSNCLNILSKKEVNQPRFYWKRTAEILTQNGEKNLHKNTILANYEVKDVCIILNSFAKVNHLFLKLIEVSTKIITTQIRNLHTRELCNVIHSLGKLNQMNPLSEIILKLFKDGKEDLDNIDNIFKTIEGCNEKDFSMLLRVLLINSKELEIDKVTKKLLASLSDKFDNLSDQTLAILSNSVALYGRDENDTLSILAPIITIRLRKGCFTPQCVAQISNGYARLNVQDEELFSAISERVLTNVEEFPPRSLANILNGFSKLGIFNHQLFVKTIPQLEKNVHLMTPQCIGNIINSYSKFSSSLEQRKLVSFFNKMIEGLLKLRDFDSFIGQNYANILNGVSKVYIQGYSLKEALEKELKESESKYEETKELEKGEVTENGETEELKVQELFNKLSGPILKIENSLNHLDVLMIVNAMARCRVLDEELVTHLLPKLKLYYTKYKSFEMVNVLNTLSILYACSEQSESSMNIKETKEDTGELSCSNQLEGGEEDKKIQEVILSYYREFLDYYVENLEKFKNVRSLDIRLVFNSMGKCKIYDERYCRHLVKRYIELEHFDLNDLFSISEYYSNNDLQLPKELGTYVLDSLNVEDNKDNKVLVLGQKMSINEVVERVNQLM